MKTETSIQRQIDAEKLREIARNLATWKESGPRGPENSKEARKAAEEAMTSLEVNADLIHRYRETYGVEYRQSKISLNSIDNFLDSMYLNNEAPGFFAKRIGQFDYKEFTLDDFINELNRWADELEKKSAETEQILIDLSQFSTTPSLCLFTELLKDVHGVGVQLNRGRHGKKQPQSLKDVLKSKGYEAVANKVTSKNKRVFLNILPEKITTDKINYPV